MTYPTNPTNCGENPNDECHCLSGTRPSTFTVTFSGVLANGCGTCTNYNGNNYTLTYNGSCGWEGTGECGQELGLFLFTGFGTTAIWILSIREAGQPVAEFSGPQPIGISMDVNGLINCSAGPYTLPFNTFAGDTSTECDFHTTPASVVLS